VQPQAWADYLVTSFGNFYQPYPKRQNQTLVAIRAGGGHLADLAAQVSQLATVLINNLESERATIRDAWGISRGYTDDSRAAVEGYYQDYIDLYDFSYQLQFRSANAAVQLQARRVMAGVDNLLIYLWKNTNYFGTTAHQRCFSIYFPSSKSDKGYAEYESDNLLFLRDGGQQWGLFLRAYLGHPPTIASLSASPDPVIRPGLITLTADGVAVIGGTVVNVKFYRETNNVPGLQTGNGGDEEVRGGR